MTTWFEGRGEIACTMEDVERSIANLGEHYAGMVRHMPGMSGVELVDHGSDFVTIQTNEGFMKRTNISKRVEEDRIVLECDEEYKAGSMVTANTHFRDKFTAGGSGVAHHLIMSDVKAPGVLGFLYRTFGRSRMGNAFLGACKASLESRCSSHDGT